MVIKNLENKIKLVLILCSLFLVGCVVISLGGIWTARTMVDDAQKKIYVLDGNVPILVNRSTMEETLDVEAKSHVEMFHHYFFTLAPDDKYIKYTMEKAMYLIDESGLAQYNALKEKGFYGNIMGTSAVFSIFCDSIKFNKENMPFIYYGRQRIERRTSVLMRELVTEGFVKRGCQERRTILMACSQSTGVLILNKDIEARKQIQLLNIQREYQKYYWGKKSQTRMTPTKKRHEEALKREVLCRTMRLDKRRLLKVRHFCIHLP